MTEFQILTLCEAGLGDVLRHHHHNQVQLEGVAEELVERGDDPIEVAEFLEDERAWRDLDEEGSKCQCSETSRR